jgi:flagellar motor switch protein FliN/FliY
MTEQTLDTGLSAIAASFAAAAAAAAAALGLDPAPEVTDIVHASADALGRPATLAASMAVAGPLQGDLVLVTTAELDGVLDDRELGGLTALSNRVRALRAAADVLGARYGEPQEIDPSDTSADIAAVLSVGGQAVGIIAVRVPRPADQGLPTAGTDLADSSDTGDDSQTGSADATAAPAAVAVPVPSADEQRDPGFRSFAPGNVGAGHGPVATRLDQLTHVEMEVTVEIGRTRMTVGSLLGLAPGQVVELDRAAGAPVDLFVNGTLLARGEVVVVDEDFGFRVTEIVTSREG